MAGKITANTVQLGDSATATNNFVLKTNVDGTAVLARGNDGATSQDILTVDAAGSVDVVKLNLRGDGAEGGQVGFNNPDNSAVGMFVDVGGANIGRVFSTTNNFQLLLGQLGGTGGSVKLYTAASERLLIDASGNVLVTSPTGLGYGTGSGGSVTQITNKVTAVTINKPTGKIITISAFQSAGTTITFTVNNSLVTANDTVVIAIVAVSVNGSSNYNAWVGSIEAGLFTINVKNISGSNLTDSIVINFAIIKGAIT